MLKKNKYDCDLESLDISNCGIVGILNLSRFRKLKELDCSNNLITSIENLSTKINKINCSNNQIQIFNHNFRHIQEINIKSNSIIHLNFKCYFEKLIILHDFDKLESIIFDDSFNFEINNLFTMKYIKKN